MNKFCIKKSHLFLIIIFLTLVGFFYLITKLTANQLSYNAKATAVKSKTYKSSNLIISGQPVQTSKWPFVIALFNKKNFKIKKESGDFIQEKKPDNEDRQMISNCLYSININSCLSNVYYRYFCGGTIIAKNWVVTAAHCVIDIKKEDLGVAVGLNDLKNDVIDWKTKTIVGVDKIITHEDYFMPKLATRINIDGKKLAFFLEKNDIALLHLKTPVNNSISISDDKALTNPNVQTYTFGYGAESPMGIQSKYLNMVQLNLNPLPDSFINQIRTGTYKSYKTPCNGDSGGPLITYSNNRWFLIGITIYGPSENRSNWRNTCNGINIYTNVVSYYQWIKDNTGIKVNEGAYFGTKPN